MNKMSI